MLYGTALYRSRGHTSGRDGWPGLAFDLAEIFPDEVLAAEVSFLYPVEVDEPLS